MTRKQRELATKIFAITAIAALILGSVASAVLMFVAF